VKGEELFRPRKDRTQEDKPESDPLTHTIIGCAIEVHRVLGPGLLESAYQQCLAHELHLAGIGFELERPLPVVYKDVRLDCGYRVDLLVENEVVVELKCVTELTSVHYAQILTYMKLSGVGTGLLINFNVTKLAQGIKRFKL
jgi:GxxExxY protein